MVDIAAIGRAPLDHSDAEDSRELIDARALIGQLSEQLAGKEAELAAATAKRTVEDVKASILEAYVNKVFTFVALYCGAVGMFLFCAALPGDYFELPETILAIIAGSTAVSVIGLIGLVISGLFGSKQPVRRK